MNNQTKVIIALALLLIISVGYILYINLAASIYKKGYETGKNDLIITMNKNGIIPVIVEQELINKTTNETYVINTLQEKSLNDLCRGTK